jgi:hypothetical protein
VSDDGDEDAAGTHEEPRVEERYGDRRDQEDRSQVLAFDEDERLRVREDSGAFAWVALNPRSAAVLERAARDLPPFSKARLRGIEVEPLEEQVVEAPVRTAQSPATPIESGTTPWGWIAGGALAVALGLAMVTWAILRRRRAERRASRRSAITDVAAGS